MWQRFSASARKAVFYAQEEAQKFGEGYVSTEHLLLGLIREDGTTAAKILEILHVPLHVVRAEVEKQLPRGKNVPSLDMTLTPRAKRVIDLAYEEARGFSDEHIGTEHLLLGLLREAEGLAGRVLTKLGVVLESTRAALIEVRKSMGQEVNPYSATLSDAALSHVVTQFAEKAMTRMLLLRQGICRLEALALVIVPEPNCELLLKRVNINPLSLRSALERRISAAIYQADPDAEAGLALTFALAAEEARVAKQEVSAPHILIALYRGENNELSRFLRDKACSLEMLREAVLTLPE